MSNLSDVGVSAARFSIVFKFENDFNFAAATAWMNRNWTISILLVCLYVPLLFWGQHWMKHRQRYHLRCLLLVWNVMLALFSTVSSVRMLTEVFYVLQDFGFHYSVCSSCESGGCSTVALFWLFLFILSKAVELGDTAFVVLRKQPLYFLHWFHHATVLLYSWFSYSETASNGRWFSTINMSVHAIMYSYYALKSCSVRVPRSVSKAITTAQISQMLFGCFINFYTYWSIRSGKQCEVTMTNVYVSFAMYASYFVLFAWYFYKAYLYKHQRRRSIDDIEGVSLKME